MALTPEKIAELDAQFGAQPQGSLTPEKIAILDAHFGVKNPDPMAQLQGEFEAQKSGFGKVMAEGAAREAAIQGTQDNMGSKALQRLGSGAQTATGLGIEAIKKTMPQNLKDMLGAAAQEALAGANKLGNALPDVTPQIDYRFSPETTRNIEAGLNLAGAMPIAGAAPTVAKAALPVAKAGVKIAATPLKAVANEASALKAGYQARGVDELVDAADIIKNRSSAAYANMRQMGAEFTPATSSKIAKEVGDALKKDGVLNERLHGNSIGLYNDFAKELQSGNVGLEGLDQWRQLFGEVAGNFNDPINQRKASIMIDAIDDAVDSLQPTDLLSGSKDAVDALNLGRQEWRKYKKFSAISEIVKKSDGDANYLKRELKKFVDNPKKTRGFTKEEKMKLQTAAELSTGEGIYKMLGKFGIDLGNSRLGSGVGAVVGSAAAGALGGASGAALAPAVGTAARQAQKYKARGKVENLLKEIER
ncbi:MAG: hypothetical protein WC091_02720 [Sulfuricellaceae bacterium]